MSDRISAGSAHGLADVAAFVDALNGLDRHPLEQVRSLFDPATELVVARAPGRLDVMGGIADYSGSLVLQWPLQAATRVALQRRPERRLRVVSLGAERNGRSAAFELELEALAPAGRPLTYAQAQQRLAQKAEDGWAAYVAGVFLVLMRERGVQFRDGAHLLIDSSVPEGKGVSSSAALEVAVMQAVAAAFELPLEARELALLCQKAENLVVGAACGVMDQMTAACGKAHHLLALLCQPAELQGFVALPAELAIWGVDSGIRHAVSGSDYARVRAGAFMGYRLLAERAGLKVKACGQGRVQIEDTRWQGYLANLTPREFEAAYAPHLPSAMKGQAFLERYHGTCDPVTRIDPQKTYPILQPTQHPIYEHARVGTFAKLLAAPGSARQRELLGALMYESHAAYSSCGLGSADTDLLVELVRRAGPKAGVYGAKISGGGSGGTVVVLGRQGAQEAIGQVAADYERKTGHRPLVFAGSTLGAADFGSLRLRAQA